MVDCRVFLVFSIYVCLLASNSVARRKDMSVPILRIKEFRNCRGTVSPNRVENVSIAMKGRGMNLLSLEYVVVKPFTKAKIQISISKCTTECESFLNFNVNLCRSFEETGMPWTRLFQNSKPTLKCPIKKGTYVMTNATFDTNEIVDMGLVGVLEGLEERDLRVVFEVNGRKEEVLTCGTVLLAFSRIKRDHARL